MKGPLLIAIAASMWGGWSLATRPAERAAGGHIPAAFECLVIIAAGGLLLSVPFFFERRAGAAKPLDRKAHLLIAALGVSDAFNFLCFFTAMQKTTVAVTVLTHYLAPILVSLTAPLVVKEPWRARTFVALAIGFAGLMLLLRPWSSMGGGVLEGAAWGSASAIFFAANFFLGKELSDRIGIGQLSVLPKLWTVPVLALFVPWGEVPAVISAPVLGWLLMGTALFGSLPLLLFYRGLRTSAASQASILSLCEPLAAVVVGTVVWREPLGAVGVAGATLVVIGAAVALGRPRSHSPA